MLLNLLNDGEINDREIVFFLLFQTQIKTNLTTVMQLFFVFFTQATPIILIGFRMNLIKTNKFIFVIVVSR